MLKEIFHCDVYFYRSFTKMMPLKPNQLVFAWFCVYSKNESPIWWKKALYITFTVIVWMVVIGAFSSSAAFFLKYASSDLEEALYAVFQMTTLLTMATGLALLHYFRQKLIDIFSKLSCIYEESKDLDKHFISIFNHFLLNSPTFVQVQERDRISF